MARPRKYQHTFRVPKDPKQPLKYWQGVVELKAEGKTRRRKYVRSKDRDKAEALCIQALKDKDAGGGDMPTRAITVKAWINEWFDTMHVREIKPKTAHTYRGLIAREILPAIGDIRLERLSTRDVRMMLDRVMKPDGKRPARSSTTAAQVHRILAVALKAAVAEGHIPRNVASLTKAPRRAAPQLVALNAEQGMKVLEVAADDPWGSLAWAILLTGSRQGEHLGLEIDRVTDLLDLSWQLQRLTWEHGCAIPCGRKRGTDCRSRKITHPADWEGRYLQGGLWLTRPKSRAGRRVLPLVEPLASVIDLHLRATADDPNPHGLVWRMPDGSPIDPRVESEWWHNLLARAGVPDVRLHDGRHTTVDLLYDAGVAEDVIMEIVGHSVRSVSRGYKSGQNIARRIVAMEKLAAMLTPLDGARSETLALSE